MGDGAGGFGGRCFRDKGTQVQRGQCHAQSHTGCVLEDDLTGVLTLRVHGPLKVLGVSQRVPECRVVKFCIISPLEKVSTVFMRFSEWP